MYGGGAVWNDVPWNGVAWNGVAWNGVAWNDVAWNGVAWNGVGIYGGYNVVARNGIAWNGSAWIAWNKVGMDRFSEGVASDSFLSTSNISHDLFLHFNTSLRQDSLWFYTSWYLKSWQLYSVHNASKPHHITESCDCPFRYHVHFPDGDCINLDGRRELPCITIQSNTTRRRTSCTRSQLSDTLYPALSHIACKMAS